MPSASSIGRKSIRILLPGVDTHLRDLGRPRRLIIMQVVQRMAALESRNLTPDSHQRVLDVGDR